MRNSHRKTLMMLGSLAALLAAVTGVSMAFDPQTAPPGQAQTQTKSAPPAAPAKPPAAEEKKAEDKPAVSENEQNAEGKATERFIPSQKTSADNSATFPVDI